MRNIALIGMPGCGKTTIGRELAKRMTWKFLCTDEYVEASNGMRIPEIFEKFGEQRFRKYEQTALTDLMMSEQAVISTGGGIVLSELNRHILSRAMVIWLKRDITELAREGRPLSRGLEELYAMYELRKPLYETLANITVNVQGSVECVVDEIILVLQYAY